MRSKSPATIRQFRPADTEATVGFSSELSYKMNDVLVLGKRLIADA